MAGSTTTFLQAYGFANNTTNDAIPDLLEDIDAIGKTLSIEQNEEDVKRTQFVDKRTMLINTAIVVLTSIPFFYITTQIQFFFVCFVCIATIFFFNNIYMYWTSKRTRLNQTINVVNSQFILDNLNWIIIALTFILLNIIRVHFSSLDVNPLYLILLLTYLLGFSGLVNAIAEKNTLDHVLYFTDFHAL